MNPEAAEAKTKEDSSRARRWAAEAFVIVGSILLAFALDAWWGERLRVSELESDLLDVRREVSSSLDDLQLVRRFHLLRHRLADGIGGALDDASDGVARVRARDVGFLLPQSTSDFQTITVEGFIAAGGLELLGGDAALALQRWPGVVADLVDDQIEVRAITEREMTPRLRSAADLRPAIFTNVPDVIETGGPDTSIDVDVSRELKNLFAWRASAEWEIARTMGLACDLAIEIIAAIDARVPSDAAAIPASRCDAPALWEWATPDPGG